MFFPKISTYKIQIRGTPDYVILYTRRVYRHAVAPFGGKIVVYASGVEYGVFVHVVAIV